MQLLVLWVRVVLGLLPTHILQAQVLCGIRNMELGSFPPWLICRAGYNHLMFRLIIWVFLHELILRLTLHRLTMQFCHRRQFHTPVYLIKVRELMDFMLPDLTTQVTQLQQVTITVRTIMVSASQHFKRQRQPEQLLFRSN